MAFHHAIPGRMSTTPAAVDERTTAVDQLITFTLGIATCKVVFTTSRTGFWPPVFVFSTLLHEFPGCIPASLTSRPCHPEDGSPLLSLQSGRAVL